MTLAIILTIFAVVVIIVLSGSAIQRKRQLSVNPKPAKQIQSIDIEAFRNLVDPAEREYLRRSLPSSEFRTVQRERLRAMLAYVYAVNRNAALLSSIAQRAVSSNDPSTAEAARQLVNNALFLRLNATLALAQIYSSLALGSNIGAAPILQGYIRLTGSAMLLGRLQNPAAPVRISAT